MEQSTVAPEQEQTVAEEAPVEESRPDLTEARIFRFSDFIHVGEGSSECPHAIDGKCQDPSHFHAWVRLPNKFQVQQIREKAQAARGRLIRQARDPETDRWEIIENQIAEAKFAGSESMIEELLTQKEWQVRQQVQRELVNDDGEESDGDDDTSRWATIEEDQSRFRYLSGLDEADREDDEFNELMRHLQEWNQAFDARYKERVQPERESLEARTDEELGQMLREIAVTEQADAVFMRIYARWQMVVCTLRPNGQAHPKDRIFSSAQQFEAESPEVIAGLEAAFNALEGELNNRMALRAEGN